MTDNELTYIIRGCIFEVYNTIGPGLLESVYEVALEYELKEKGLNVSKQIPLSMFYKTVNLNVGFRLDLLIEERVIIEVKSIESLLNVHHKQLLTYLKIADLRFGLLVNFNTDNISKNIIRKVNGY